MHDLFQKETLEHIEYQPNSTQIALDGGAVTETRIMKNKLPANDINLTNHSYEYCPTESSDRISVSYIGSHLLYKPKTYLCIYKTAELKSRFIKLIETKKSNVINGTIYRHLNMDIDEFNERYLNSSLEMSSKANINFYVW